MSRTSSPAGWIAALTLVASLLGASPAARSQGADPEAAFQAGVQALRAGQVYDAIERLRLAELARPDDPQLQVLLGQAHLAAGLWVPARRNFEAALAADPGDGLAAFMVGYTLYLSARYPEAEEALARAQTMARDNPNPTIYRALALLRLGQLDEAELQLDLAGRAARDDPAALRGLAEIALARDDLEAALGHAAAAASRAPTDVETRILLGQIQLRRGEAAAALPDLERLANEHSNRSDVLYVYSQVLLRSGRREAGRQAVERFRTQKAVEERIRLLEAELSVDPGNLERRLDLVEALLSNGQPGTARIHLGPAVRDHPGDPRVQTLADRVRR